MRNVIQHDRGPIGRLVVRVTGAAGAVSVELPRFTGYLLALQTVPDLPGAGAYDVRVRHPFGLDMLDGCGLARDLARVQRCVVRFANTDTHPVVVSDDRLTLEVRGLPAGAGLELSLYYGKAAK